MASERYEKWLDEERKKPVKVDPQKIGEGIKDTVNGVKSFVSDTDNLKQVASMALPVAMMAFMNKFFPEEPGDNSIDTNTVEQDKLGWE